MKKLSVPITLATLRANPKLRTMITLQPGSRLSVTPVTTAEFKALKQLLDRWFPQGGILSMGMSGDYRIAIEEGSNMVRIGSLLFGKRG